MRYDVRRSERGNVEQGAPQQRRSRPDQRVIGDVSERRKLLEEWCRRRESNPHSV